MMSPFVSLLLKHAGIDYFKRMYGMQKKRHKKFLVDSRGSKVKHRTEAFLHRERERETASSSFITKATPQH